MSPVAVVTFGGRGKRALDLAIAAPLTALLLPLILVIALLVRLDSRGPAFFRQWRVGLGGRPFRMWKFRSMYAGAPQDVHLDLARQWFTGAPVPSSYKAGRDPRVTRAGRLLRRMSLDELPQLFNVLMGDMSLVGPRPAIPYELDFYETWHRERFEAPPGMTGLWQVTGRDHLPAPVMMELDVRYVRDRSLGLDLRILARTLPALFGRYSSL